MHPYDIRGLAISGRMLSGKDSLYKIVQSYVEGDYVQRIAFADKLKLIAKEMLCIISSYVEHGLCLQRNLTYRDHFQSFCRRVSKDLFNEEVGDLADQVYQKLKDLSRQNHVLLHARRNIQMPHITKEFGFADIDALLWSDCGKPRQMLQELGTECMRSIRDTVWVDYVLKNVRIHPEHFFAITDIRFPNEIDLCRKEGFLDVRIEASEETRKERSLKRDGLDSAELTQHSSETSLDGYDFQVIIKNDGSPEDLRTAILENEKTRDLLVLLKRRSARQMLAACD